MRKLLSLMMMACLCGIAAWAAPSYETVTLPYEETFASDLGKFVIENTTLPEEVTYVWKHDASYSCMKASAYVGGKRYATESWLVSPVIDLSKAQEPKLTFQHAGKYFGTIANEAQVYARVEGGEWTQLTVDAYPADWNFVDASIDLTGYAGKKVQVGFKYTSTSSVAGTWEVKNVKVVDANQPAGPTYETVEFPYSETFATDQGKCVVENDTLPSGTTSVWKMNTSLQCITVSGYISRKNMEVITWLVTPIIDMSKAKNPALFYEHTGKFFANKSGGDWTKDGAQICVREAGGAWKQLTVNNWFTGQDWNFVSDVINLKDYAGKQVQIGFRYHSTTECAPTWELKNVKVDEGPVVYEQVEYPYSEKFDQSQGKFVIEDETLPADLTYVWKYDTNKYMKASAYAKKTNYDAVSWLVSPVIDLASAKDPLLTYTHTGKYFVSMTDQAQVYVREAGGEWKQLTVNNWFTGNDWNKVDDAISLKDYAGKKVQVGFKYTSTSAGSPTWEVMNFKVAEDPAATAPTEVADISAYLNVPEGTQVKFTSPVTVTYTDANDTRYLYVKDASGYMLIYNSGVTTYKNGDVIPAGFTGTVGSYSGVRQLIEAKDLQPATETAAAEPEVKTEADITEALLNAYVKLEKVKVCSVDGRNFSIGDPIAGYNQFNQTVSLDGIDETKLYDVTGIVSAHNGTIQILPTAIVENVSTGVDAVEGAKAVAKVEYVNVAGVRSSEPFDGVNIVVTTYVDGSKQVAKVLK